MSFIATQPASYLGTVVGDGHCVAYVRAAANVPPTAQWRAGEPVWRQLDTLDPGTAIATFDPQGQYANNTDGSSHAAIFLGPDVNGFAVYDQWKLHPVARRVIRAKGGVGPACDDADAYQVIEVTT